MTNKMGSIVAGFRLRLTIFRGMIISRSRLRPKRGSCNFKVRGKTLGNQSKKKEASADGLNQQPGWPRGPFLSEPIVIMCASSPHRSDMSRRMVGC